MKRALEIELPVKDLTDRQIEGLIEFFEKKIEEFFNILEVLYAESDRRDEE